jgi:SAM-dependent methyltransferase
MKFETFDSTRYATVGMREGYAEWAPTYEQSVVDEMDLRLLERIESMAWRRVQRAADLACGTGRTGQWLRAQGVAHIDGVDLTHAMLDRARAHGAHDTLSVADIRSTGLSGDGYDLCICCLADEHIPGVVPLYAEVERLLTDRGFFVIVGYHPHYVLTNHIPTHCHRADGQAVAMDTHVHLFSDHVAAARAAGMQLVEMHERLIDEAWMQFKPKWADRLGQPISFAMVWELDCT